MSAPESPRALIPIRLQVVGPGLVLGGLFAGASALLLPANHAPFDQRFAVWAAVAGGPVLGTVAGPAGFMPAVAAGWLGLPLAAAHPIRPHWATGALSCAGLALWYLVGWVTAIAPFY